MSLHNTLPGSVAHESDTTVGRMPLGSPRAQTVVSRAVRTVVGWAVRRAALVTGASDDLVELARLLGARQAELATVASPAVPRLLAAPVTTPAERRAAREALGGAVGPAATGCDVPLVLTVARIAPQKDLPTLVAAAGSLHSPARWVVVGGGDERLRASLESELSGIPLDLVGAQPDVEAWLQAADVFVLTSRWEARALVVQEAMAAGLPVVATRTGGLPGSSGRRACSSCRGLTCGGRRRRPAARRRGAATAPVRRGSRPRRRRGRLRRRRRAAGWRGTRPRPSHDVDLKPVVETTKHIFVTGGVASSLGKGLTASSLGRLLRSRGLRVTMQKLDPYINVDPGTMNPFQHGEVFVTDDGAETDLDIGHYERFLDVNLVGARQRHDRVRSTTP